MTESAPPVERIGLVLVHGVGEQKRFDHLTAEVRHLVAALEALPDTRVSVNPSATQDSGVGAAHESWRADEVPPIRIHVEQGPGSKRFCLCLHEVWWADLDDKETLWNRVKFWFWGLGFWLASGYRDPLLEGAKDMQPPKLPPFRVGGERLRGLSARLRLFGFAVVFILSAVSLNVINYALRKLRLGELPGGDVFYQFVGDVKLYQDDGRRGKGPLTDLGDPRRVAIRRRLVRVFVDAYRAQYDRWYVLAHSLGTVVAWNGLMETAHALPNYLSQETWAALKAAKDPVLGRRRDGKQRPVADMMPSRPAWIDDDDEVLYRDKLFERLRGFVTYGSPLDKFAHLWPQIVNINNDTAVWNRNFEWVNVYEHTDPVSSRLAAYSGGTIPADSPAPTNLAYKASLVLLLSHLKYLELKTKGGKVPRFLLVPLKYLGFRSKAETVPRDVFVVRLVNWILEGQQRFPKPGRADSHWYRRSSPGFGIVWRAPQWVLATVALVALIAYPGVWALLGILAWLAGVPESGMDGVTARFSGFSFVERLLGTLAVSAVLVTIFGIAKRILDVSARPQPQAEHPECSDASFGPPSPSAAAEIGLNPKPGTP